MNPDPRILVVTPEISYFPQGMGSLPASLRARAGCLADVSAALVNALYYQGVDVHVAIPDDRFLSSIRLPKSLQRGLRNIRGRMPGERVHMAADRAFYHRHGVYNELLREKVKVALAFQREVIHNIIPRLQPDLVHCKDWTTGLIPAAASKMGIPCLFTVHNIHTVTCSLAVVEDRGIDAAEFRDKLYFERTAASHEETRASNPVDFLASGIFAARFVNTISPSFLLEVAQGRHASVPVHLQHVLAQKVAAECAAGILNAPDSSFNPKTDRHLSRTYDAGSHPPAKRTNKYVLQRRLGLIEDVRAPLFFWPSRLDPVQKGCRMLAHALCDVVSRHREKNLQIVFAADGEFQTHFRNIAALHDFSDRVAACGLDEPLARLTYGASDFVLLPSLFEPCGLPRMIGSLYGALPVAHKTGAIRDTVRHLSPDCRSGNGFLFETFDTPGLVWAIEEALRFHGRSDSTREATIARIMAESSARFNHAVTARQYVALYEQVLRRPVASTPPAPPRFRQTA